MAEKCYKDQEPHFQCCCICAHRMDNFSHPSTDGKSVLSLRGYICYPGEVGPFSGWSKHGIGCELFDRTLICR